MSWLSTLYETYENMSKSGLFPELIPIAHTMQQAQIEVTINECSEFVGAGVVPKEDAETLIPCTEKSAGRSGSHPVNHPLMDKLQYVAGDYTKYGGTKGDSFHQEYMEDLAAWCESEYANPKVQILYHYLSKGTLIEDLVKSKILHCDDNGKLYQKYPDKKNEPEIFKRLPGDQSDAFVRFRIIGFTSKGNNKAALWQDKKLQENYIRYYQSQREEQDLCYVLGKKSSLSVNHSSKLRNTGDMAKLISANDTSGYTFRGRFLSAEEAAGISYEVSQGAHNALKWLIKNQGRNYGGRVYVAWNPKGYEIPKIDEDSAEALFGQTEGRPVPCTAKKFATELLNYMSGYQARPDYYDKVAIMGIDAATTGRMAVTFYREERQNELLDNLYYWHTTCAWLHRYKLSEDKKVIEFYGAPSLKDIVLAAFGVERTNYLEADEKLQKNMVERLLHCIIDRAGLPRDIVNAAYRNACHPQNYKNYYSWLKVVTICCALLKKYYGEKNEKEEWTVELNKNEESLPYLCGRLLAVADALEKSTFNEEDQRRRETNAIRYFTKFMEHPCQTWEILNKRLVPYLAKLGPKAYWYQGIMGEISIKIKEEEFLTARYLDGRMLLGFYSQQHDIYRKKEDKQEEKQGRDKEDNSEIREVGGKNYVSTSK